MPLLILWLLIRQEAANYERKQLIEKAVFAINELDVDTYKAFKFQIETFYSQAQQEIQKEEPQEEDENELPEPVPHDDDTSAD